MAPDDYRTQVRAEVENVLSTTGVPFVGIPPVAGGPHCIALRDTDWSRAVDALRKSDLSPLLGPGTPGTHASRVAYSPSPDDERINRSPLVHVLVPAVSRHANAIIRRYGFESAVRLERWTPTAEGFFAPPIWNSRTGLLASEAFSAITSSDGGGAGSDGVPSDGSAPATAGGSTGETALAAVTDPTLFEVTFPIDVVYTWVDGTDSEWLARKRASVEAFAGEQLTEGAAADLRFVDHDELRYSLRSIEQYAPWVRHVYIVTDRQRPAWLRADHPRVSMVDHTEIAPAGSSLPTYNSHAIEANLHRIEGLSEHFLYFNDDMFLSSPVEPSLFFAANGIASMFLSRAQVGPGAPLVEESASDSAGKNARTLVQEVCGRRVSRKLFHVPYPLQRSVANEIEERWPEIVTATRSSTFRRISDVTLAGALHLNYAFATARAVTHGIRYRYVDVGRVTAASELERLYRDRDLLQTFCLNESDPELDAATIDRLVRGFLRRRFPDASTFEIPGVT